jgi:hypothetical protein
VIVKLNQSETFGYYSQYVMVHSRDLREVQDALTELAGSVKVPGQALLQKEEEGALAAYMALFPET